MVLDPTQPAPAANSKLPHVIQVHSSHNVCPPPTLSSQTCTEAYSSGGRLASRHQCQAPVPHGPATNA